MTTKRMGAANAQHSAATTYLLPTPALRTNRRIRDFTQTNSLDMALSHNAASTVVRQYWEYYSLFCMSLNSFAPCGGHLVP